MAIFFSFWPFPDHFVKCHDSLKVHAIHILFSRKKGQENGNFRALQFQSFAMNEGRLQSMMQHIVSCKAELIHVILNYCKGKLFREHSLPGPTFCFFASMIEVKFEGLPWLQK